MSLSKLDYQASRLHYLSFEDKVAYHTKKVNEFQLDQLTAEKDEVRLTLMSIDTDITFIQSVQEKCKAEMQHIQSEHKDLVEKNSELTFHLKSLEDIAGIASGIRTSLHSEIYETREKIISQKAKILNIEATILTQQQNMEATTLSLNEKKGLRNTYNNRMLYITHEIARQFLEKQVATTTLNDIKMEQGLSEVSMKSKQANYETFKTDCESLVATLPYKATEDPFDGSDDHIEAWLDCLKEVFVEQDNREDALE